MKILQGDCISVLKDLAQNSVDSIVTDPPYELGFMGKSWDSTGIANNTELWKECLRVLKPGGHLLAFSGTRTYHRMACAIEDAGFEVRDMIEWVYGSGFPKSLNIGKAVDKIAGETGRKEKFTAWMRSTGITTGEINKITNSFMGSHYLTAKEQPAIPTSAIWTILRPHIKTEIPKWVDELVERIEREREVVGKDKNWGEKSDVAVFTGGQEWDITKGTSEWEGWGTALKPAHEPICMARKPLAEKTVAENVLKYGTGGINIDESRVGTDDTTTRHNSSSSSSYMTGEIGAVQPIQEEYTTGSTLGRFPANLIHDNSEEVRECFPSPHGAGSKRGAGEVNHGEHTSIFGIDGHDSNGMRFGDSGNASRFFKSIIYQAKASKSERNKGCEGLPLGEAPASAGSKPAEGRENALGKPRANNHPTVKPIALMEYLIKMVTPKGGVVLDPFMGSGSTGVAAKNNGYDFIGIDITPEYIEIAKARIGNDTGRLPLLGI